MFLGRVSPVPAEGPCEPRAHRSQSKFFQQLHSQLRTKKVPRRAVRLTVSR